MLSATPADWAVRFLVTVIPLVLITLAARRSSQAGKTFDRSAIRSGTTFAWLTVLTPFSHPVLLAVSTVSVPHYYFAASWLAALLALPLLQSLSRARVQARRGRWRSPRYGDLARPRTEEALSKWTRWRRRVVDSVVEGESFASELGGAAKNVLEADLLEALEERAMLEERREREELEAAQRRRLTAKRRAFKARRERQRSNSAPAVRPASDETVRTNLQNEGQQGQGTGVREADDAAS